MFVCIVYIDNVPVLLKTKPSGSLGPTVVNGSKLSEVEIELVELSKADVAIVEVVVFSNAKLAFPATKYQNRKHQFTIFMERTAWDTFRVMF